MSRVLRAKAKGSVSTAVAKATMLESARTRHQQERPKVKEKAKGHAGRVEENTSRETALKKKKKVRGKEQRHTAQHIHIRIMGKVAGMGEKGRLEP